MKIIFLSFLRFVLIISSSTSFGQAPNLGTATDFALFTSNGAVTNTTTTTITGNIGTNLGAISGFDPPSIVNGIIYTQDAVTLKVATDLQNAYDQLLSTPTTIFGHAPAFGSETILAGVYSIGGAGSLDGDITLDAAGDAAAVFIIKFNGAFTVGAASRVLLQNGALAGNVFWLAEGAISMAADVTMAGTLIAHDGANSLGTGSSLNGRMLSTTGAISVYFNTIAKPTSGGYIPVPITLLSFNGFCIGPNNLLSWTTGTEYNNKYFTLERSENTYAWKTIAVINGAGNSTIQQNYSYIDTLLNTGNFYYRLRQTDFDNRFKYSPIIYVKNCGNLNNKYLNIYSNPAGNKLSLSYTGNKIEITLTQIYNPFGQKIFEAKGFKEHIDLSHKISGIYYIRIILKNTSLIKGFLLK